MDDDSDVRSHRPVLLAETMDGLSLRAGDVAVDCTFGRGGHSRGMLDTIGQGGRLLALDKDEQAVLAGNMSGVAANPCMTLVHASYASLAREVERLGFLGKVSGILMDLGVSSPQLDEAERGFSFMRNGPLDMRMDRSGGETAAQWLATVREERLAEVLLRFGEERHARGIAREIVRRRRSEPLTTTGDLARLIERCVPYRAKGKHPATRCFQAIRIHINRELEELEAGLRQAVDVLRPGGRLVVISFHSLEDRMVKRFMRDSERGLTPEQCRYGSFGARLPRLKRIGAAVRPGPGELHDNVRSRSAVLRVAEKVEP